MRHRSTPRGFTIVETLIFLTVSASVFVGAIGQYSAQQRQVQFNQGVRGLQANLVSLISEVSSSYTPDISTSHCQALNDNSPVSFPFPFTPGATSDCIFLGKAIGFGGDGTNYCSADTIASCSHYVIIPIVARREFFTSNVGSPVVSLVEAKPLALSNCTASGSSHATSFPCGTPNVPWSTRPDLAERKQFDQNIGIYKAYRRSSTGANIGDIGGFAFVFNLSSSSYSSDDGASSVDLAVLPTAGFKTNDESHTAKAIESLADGDLNPKDGITLCLMDSYGKKSVITVGANNSKTDVQVEPSSKFDPGC